MKKSTFSYSLIIEALKGLEGVLSARKLCRELGMVSATLHKLRAKDSR